MANPEVNYEVLLRIEAKANGIEQHLSDQDKTLARHETKLDITNGRVGSLEVWRGYITGGLVIVGLVVGWVITKLW